MAQKERVDRMVAKAKELGFENQGFDGRGHIVLKHVESGETTRIAASPGDFRGDKNALAHMERVSGKKLERHANRRSRKKNQIAGYSKTVRTPSAAAWSDRINELIREHKDHWLALQILMMPPFTNTDKNHAMWLIRRLDQIETFLKELNQPLPEGNTQSLKRGLTDA